MTGRAQLDAGRSAWLQGLNDALDVEVWHAPSGSSRRRVLTTLVGGVRGALLAPRLTARAFVAGTRSGGLRAGLRSLLIAARRADVVYFPRPEDAFGYLPAMRLRPSVVSIAPGEGGRAARAISQVLGSATIVHCMFDVDRCELEGQGLAAPARSMVARAGFDPQVYTTEQPIARTLPLRALIACGFWPRTGVEDALVATRIATDRGLDVRLDIIGAGQERERVVHAVHDLGLSAVALVHDPLPSDGLVAALRKVHVFIHPHLMGALGWPALTAMALGVPVVAIDAGSAAEIIRDGREGFVVPYGDVGALADRLARISSDPTLASSMIDHARRRVTELFDIGAQAATFTSVLQAAVRP